MAQSQRVITYVLRHDGVDLGTIVQDSQTTLLIYPHSSYILSPMSLLKGVWIQEGSLWGGFHATTASIWGIFMTFVIVRVVLAPFIDAIPLPFNCSFSPEVFMSGQLQMKCSGLLQW